MMLKTTPKRSLRSRVLYVLPMIALALSAFATSEFQTASDFIEQTINASPTTFTLKGTVPAELNIKSIHVIIANNDWGGEELNFIDTIYVKDGKFEYSKNLDQPYWAALAVIKKDGKVGAFLDNFLVPGEECKIDIYGEGMNDYSLGGSKFYRDWEAFHQFYDKEINKMKDGGRDAFVAAIADYNHKHKDEEGCIMFQVMWTHASIDFSIADGIQDGRFKLYIQHQKLLHNNSKEQNRNEIDIHITDDGKLFFRGKKEYSYKLISPKELMETLSLYKNVPTTINIYSEKELETLNMVKNTARQNNLLKINYSVIGKKQ